MKCFVMYLINISLRLRRFILFFSFLCSKLWNVSLLHFEKRIFFTANDNYLLIHFKKIYIKRRLNI